GKENQWDIPDKTLLKNVTQLYLKRPLLSFDKLQKVLQSFDSLYHLRLNVIFTEIKKALLSTVCKIATLRILDLSEIDLNNETLKLAPCSQLTVLDLSVCCISELPKGSIDSMKHLKSLNVSYNWLTKIPHDIRNLSSLAILIINNNFISHLSCEDFVNTTRLTELHLNVNRITKLQRCVMENLTNLKLLNLSDNLLVTFRAAIKVGLQKLEVLDISHNFIKLLDNGDLRGLKSLKYLNVTSDVMETVKYKTFFGLKNLQFLSGSFPFFYANVRPLKELENVQININYREPFQIPYSNSYEQTVQMKSLKSLSMACKSETSHV
uniref:Uncharacterized protein n=1 Tax=Fundulus heteroclitus TaxID=8078 RepID=A0A3Q2TF82_FUNHE